MTHEALIGLGLVGWFVALALAEAMWPLATQDGSGDGRLLTNFGLTVLIFLGSALPPLANFGSAMIGAGIGIGYHVPLPWAAMFLLTLLGQTLAAYWIHRMMHGTPLLWRVHRVHHADTAVDVSTSLRSHPLELLFIIPTSAAVTLALGSPVSAVVAVQTLLFAGAIWEHADVALPRQLDRALAFVLVTPRLHRLHHSPDRRSHDSNYGSFLMVWDRLFGTINDNEAQSSVGLEHQSADPNRLIAQIFSPLHAA